MKLVKCDDKYKLHLQGLLHSGLKHPSQIYLFLSLNYSPKASADALTFSRGIFIYHPPPSPNTHRLKQVSCVLAPPLSLSHSSLNFHCSSSNTDIYLSVY